MPLPDSTIAALANSSLTLADRVVGIVLVVEYFRREAAGVAAHRLRGFTYSGRRGLGHKAGVSAKTAGRAVKTLAQFGVLESRTRMIYTPTGPRLRVTIRPVANSLMDALAAIADAIDANV